MGYGRICISRLHRGHVRGGFLCGRCIAEVWAIWTLLLGVTRARAAGPLVLVDRTSAVSFAQVDLGCGRSFGAQWLLA